MQINRLDKIVENNVNSSADERSVQMQMLYTLHDISETLAMIYDKMCGGETVVQTSDNVKENVEIADDGEEECYDDAIVYNPKFLIDNYATLLLKNLSPVIIERYGFNGYIKVHVDNILNESFTNSTRLDVTILDILDGKMNLDMNDYGVLWRVWNKRPTKELMEETPWERFTERT